MARIVWSSVARDDLERIVSFIRAASPGYARSFAFRLRKRQMRERIQELKKERRAIILAHNYQ